ncbi:MAG: glycoside hydrolase family 78 protein [Anaerolineae bacterium]|nr:glycoside hydrolase family 78 protein [Anaerolineae bacterium]
MAPDDADTRLISLTALRTEALKDPLGIDVRRPALSWQLVAPGRGVLQAAYQIQVARTAAELKAGTVLLWDSGRVASDALSTAYGGPEGRSRERFAWHVRVWDRHGVQSPWSAPASWEMGLIEEQDWRANWIEPAWDEDPRAFKPCPFLRRAFTLDQPVVSARLYITAHGLYEAWLNGQRIGADAALGDQVFTPGYTAYDRRLQYQVYDVTALLREGENALGAILGDGWYRGRIYIAGNRNVYGTRLALLAQLEIETADGRGAILTDSHWKAATGPILKSDMRDGEVYDARLEMPGWCTAGFDDRGWERVRTLGYSKKILVASMGVPVRRKETFRPAILRTPKGETVLDFGQNLAGVVAMRVRGPRGTTVRLRHGETLDAEGNFTVAHLFTLPPLSDSRTPEFQEVRYTLRGEGEEAYEPHFTVHGFRYVKVEGYPGELTPDDFTAVAVYSDMPPTGSFTCSDPLIAKLHTNTEWSMKSNFLDLPTDCPTRERAGWTGDAQIFTPSASFLADTRAFFGKWLTELRDEQAPDGKVGNFVPNPYRLARGTVAAIARLADGSAGWGDVAVMMPWALYQAYGDAAILERQYESMKAWVGYVERRARRLPWWKALNPRTWFDRANRARQRLIRDTGYHWGEWLEPGRGGPLAMAGDMLGRILFGCPVVATAYFAHTAGLLAKIAGVLGKTDDAARYAALAEQVKAAYGAEFIGPDGRIKPDRQASYARVLAFDLAPEGLKPAIVDHLVRLIREAGTHIGTGFLSTPFLCHVLAENGALDVAYELLNQKTIPSWLYAITRGATTIWESWEGINEDGKPQLSLNHYSPGSVIDFLHRKVAGLDIAEPGYKRVAIAPTPGGGLTSARATYASVRGLIVSGWAIEDGRMRMEVVIPPTATATVTLPGATVSDVLEGGGPLAEAEGVTAVAQVGTDVRLEIGSGAYAFEYPV